MAPIPFLVGRFIGARQDNHGRGCPGQGEQPCKGDKKGETLPSVGKDIGDEANRGVTAAGKYDGVNQAWNELELKYIKAPNHYFRNMNEGNENKSGIEVKEDAVELAQLEII